MLKIWWPSLQFHSVVYCKTSSCCSPVLFSTDESWVIKRIWLTYFIVLDDWRTPTLNNNTTHNKALRIPTGPKKYMNSTQEGPMPGFKPRTTMPSPREVTLTAVKRSSKMFTSVSQDYIDAHPETVILDPLPAIRTLLDRCKSYQLIHRIESLMQGKVFQVTYGQRYPIEFSYF